MTPAAGLPPSDAELREHYARCGLALPYDEDMRSEAIRTALTGAAKDARRLAARQARAAAIQHRQPPEDS